MQLNRMKKIHYESTLKVQQEEYENLNPSIQNPQVEIHQKYEKTEEYPTSLYSKVSRKLLTVSVVAIILLFSVVLIGKSAFKSKGLNHFITQSSLKADDSNLVTAKQSKKQDQQIQISAQKKAFPSEQENQRITNSQKAFVKYQQQDKNKCFLKEQIQTVVRKSLDNFGKARSKAGINKQQFQLATRLLQVTHNINGKGKIVPILSPYDEKDIEIKLLRLQTVLQKQKSYFERKYELSKYSKQHPFCVVVHSYNNFRNSLFLRNLDSIFQQQYSNYHVVYTNDFSTQSQAQQLLQEYIIQKAIPTQKMNIILNPNHEESLSSVYNAISSKCASGQIVVLVDGDDSLIGTQVFKLLNAVYQKSGAAIVHTQNIYISSNSLTGVGFNSREIPSDILKQGSIRQYKIHFTSHLLSFYADLFKTIEKVDLSSRDGKLLTSSYQMIISVPLIELAGQRVKFLNQLVYENRLDSDSDKQRLNQGQNDEYLQFVATVDPYAALGKFPFIPYKFTGFSDI